MTRNYRTGGAPAGRGQAAGAFTLMELLAVCGIIVLLAALVIGLASYGRLTTLRARAQAEVAVVESACEAFRTDFGRYPTSTVYRGTIFPYYDYLAVYWEAANTSLLGHQLVDGGFVTASALTIRPNGAITPFAACSNAVNVGWVSTTNLQYVLMDPWERPYNYYCTYPVITTKAQVSGYTVCTFPSSPWPYDATNTVSSTNGWQAWQGGQVNAASFDFWSYGPDKKSSGSQWEEDDIGNFPR